MAFGISFKDGVRMTRACFDDCMLQVYRALLDTAPSLVEDLVVLTSANDSTHGAQSLHYVDRAVDVRIYGARPGGILAEGDPKEAAAAWVGRLRQRLGPDYDVLLEADHIHIEWQPK